VPINPCGTAMDLVRSCYTTTMRFYADSADEVPVRWYFCAPDADIFPGYTLFGSGNWASEKIDWQGPGEAAWRPREYSDGSPPGPEPILLRDGIAAVGFPPNTGPTTSTTSLQLHAGQTILVVIWNFTFDTHAPVVSVTDNAGNVYVQDFSRRGDPTVEVSCEVWRARHTGPSVITPFVVHHGSNVNFCSFGVFIYEGLVDQGPVFHTSSRGASGGFPSAGPIVDTHPSRLIFATFSSQNCTAVASVPDGFLDLGSVTTPAFAQCGDSCHQILHAKNASHFLQWTATTLGQWISAVLIYEGEPRLLLPGKHFCGDVATYAEGATIDTPSVPTDKYGIATCCGAEFPFFVSCGNVAGPLHLQILAIFNHGPTSLTFVGQSLRLIEGNPGEWGIDPDQWEEVCPGFLGFTLRCIANVWTVLTPGVFGTEFGAASQRLAPPGLLFWNVNAIAPFDVNMFETWDFLIPITPK